MTAYELLEYATPLLSSADALYELCHFWSAVPETTEARDFLPMVAAALGCASFGHVGWADYFAMAAILDRAFLTVHA